MNKFLRRHIGAPGIITFSDQPGRADVHVKDPGHDGMVRELKKRFKPVSLKGWRNILHL